MAKQLTLPEMDLKSIGSALITAAVPLGALAVVNLFAPVNLFLFDAVESVSWWIVGVGAAAAAHRWVNKR